MIVDIKYHIFTITAIFAALGIGILIGTSIIGNEAIMKEQDKIIREIGTDIQRLKNENRELEGKISLLYDELEQRKEREQKAFSLLLKDKIEGRSYLLYTDREEHRDDVQEIFRAAGAELSITGGKEEIEGKYNKVIYWPADMNKNLISIPEQEAVICRENNLLGLIMSILEHPEHGK